MYRYQPNHHWRKISKEPELPLQELENEEEVDFTVVGGGFTGLFAAYRLREIGASVAVVEALPLGQAASGRSNGQVIPHHAKSTPAEIEAKLGSRKGQLFNALVAEAPRKLFELIRQESIQCDAVERGWIHASHSLEMVDRLHDIQSQWKAFGAHVEWLDKSKMGELVGGGQFPAGWKAHDAGYLNPYALVQGLARVLTRRGAKIYQKSPVEAIEPVNGSWRVKTSRGLISCRKVLVASNAADGSFWPGLNRVRIPVRLYQIATESFPDSLQATILPGREGLSDTSNAIRAFRYDARGGLAMVGRHLFWQDGERRGKNYVIKRLREIFPDIPDRPAAEYWEGVIAATPDRMPRLMRLTPGILFSGIYSGRGLAMSLAWGRLAADLISETCADGDSPLAVTEKRDIAWQSIGVYVAKYNLAWQRLRDRFQTVR
ncbi:NAD(P)/FAD-dependent oxidoreductase [Bradyrhizobium zhanjiangense]|uniref:NAD(P)/FAD-dependent oxidoreductase n=1 Tax=Bradyrhizobium zhanjiangense TaxID=1325107 RepID=UPI00100927A2|nr:FAD-dependent oxidoreductase [Bradyrhizobium zhanjiangense]